MKKKEVNFSSLDSLEPIVKVVNEAAAALNDKDRTIKNSAIPEVLGGVAGAVIGGAASFTALWACGTTAATMFSLSGAGIMGGLAAAGGVVGGGAVAGIFVLAAPVAVLAAGGVGTVAAIKRKQLKQEKERLYKEALRKHNAIIKALKEESNADKERVEYLESLNILLQQAVKDLRADLEYVA